MAQDTFEKLYKGLLLRCPSLPLPLAQEFIKTSYRRILDRNEWGALRALSEFTIPASYSTGTIDATQGSATITGTDTVWTAAMEGRQFKVGSGPFYTISDVVSGTSLTLDRGYAQEDTTDSAYEITKVFLTPPSDFRQFKSVWDPEQGCRLRLGYVQEYVDNKDPQRSHTGEPVILAAGTYNSSGVPTFELWPRTLSSKYLPYRYFKELADLSANTDTIIYPLGGEVVLMGAQWELSKWPGTQETPNPFFNLALSDKFKQDFEKDLGIAIRLDQNIHLTDFQLAEDMLPYAPLSDLNYLRNHDALGMMWY